MDLEMVSKERDYPLELPSFLSFPGVLEDINVPDGFKNEG